MPTKMKLKPCPFCGCKNVDVINKGKFSFIECNGCLGAFYQREACSIEDNVKAWNKRTIITTCSSGNREKYTFDGEWVCTDNVTFYEKGE